MTTQSDTPGEGLVWADENMALHWIDRYAAGIDVDPQMNRILQCVALSPSVASDTAALPSGYEGLDRRTKAHIETLEYLSSQYLPGGPLDIKGAIREAIAALGRLQPGALPQPDRNRTGKEPCGECYINEGETCDICGASRATPPAPQSALGRVEPVTVKPLKWCERAGGWYADRYHIWIASGYYIVSGWDRGTNPYDTLDAAKAAAQTDYERRILSALATPLAPQPALALIEELERALEELANDARAGAAYWNGPQQPSFLRLAETASTALASAKRFKGE